MPKNAKFDWNDAKTASIASMTTQQIEYFLHLSEELHYWRTSYKLNTTQSVLSRQIKALEDELKVQLFNRSNRKVELTPAGKFLKQQWKPLLEQFQGSALYARKIQSGERGRIVINHPGSVSYDLLPDLLSRISASFPEVRVELLQMKHTQEIEMLKRFEVDLCYSRLLHEGGAVASRLIRHDTLALVVPESHPIVTKSMITPAALRNERFILATLTDGETYQMKIDQVFAHYDVEPDIRFESDFGSVIMSAVEKGLGVSIIPFSYSYASHPGVRFIKLPFEIPLYLHWRKDEENAVVKNILELTVN
jgi:DNA-binding transcriptional LysR family regulator